MNRYANKVLKYKDKKIYRLHHGNPNITKQVVLFNQISAINKK